MCNYIQPNNSRAYVLCWGDLSGQDWTSIVKAVLPIRFIWHYAHGLIKNVGPSSSCKVTEL